MIRKYENVPDDDDYCNAACFDSRVYSLYEATEIARKYSMSVLRMDMVGPYYCFIQIPGCEFKKDSMRIFKIRGNSFVAMLGKLRFGGIAIYHHLML